MTLIKIISQESEEPLNLATVKEYLRLEMDSDDLLLNNLITTTREYAENYTDLSLTSKTIEITKTYPSNKKIHLFYRPVKNILVIQCIDHQSNITELDKNDFFIEDGGYELFLYQELYYRTIKIKYETTAVSQQQVQNALLEHIGLLYQNRGAPLSSSQIVNINYLYNKNILIKI